MVNYDFVNWDDQSYIQNNELIKDLSRDKISAIFTKNQVQSTYAPLTLVSWAVDYKLGEGTPFWFHFTNLLIHLFNVVLVFYLINVLFKNRLITLGVAFLFAIHPINSEVVSWVSARKDLLFTFFYLLSLISYVKWGVNKKSKFYYIALVTFLFSLLSKGAAITLPFVLIFLDYLVNNLNRKSLLNKVPFFVLSLLFGVLGYLGQADTGATESLSNLSVINRVALGFTNYLTLVFKAIIPVHTSPFHPLSFKGNTDFPGYFYISIPLFLIAVVLLVLKLKKHKVFVFGILFFIITALPVIQFLPFGMAQYAERYAYLPYLGLFVSLCYVINKITQKGQGKKLVYIAVSVYMLGLMALTYINSNDWKNGETLWSKVIKVYPENEIGYSNLADYYRKNNQKDKAINLYVLATQKATKAYASYNQLGFIYNSERKYDLALQALNNSIFIKDDYAGSYINRGISNLNLGRLDLALIDFNKALQIAPQASAAYYNRGYTYKLKGDFERALNDFSEYILYDNKNYSAYEQIAEIYLAQNRNELAHKNAVQCLSLNEECVNCLYVNGTTLLRDKQFKEALDVFDLILLKEKHLKSMLNKGVCLMNLREFNKAIDVFDEVIKISPNWGLAYYNRSLAYKNLGNLTQSQIDIETAYKNGYGN